MFLIPEEWYSIGKTVKKGRDILARHDIEAGMVIGDYLGKIIRSGSNDENKTGLYDMRGGLNYDILANPRTVGVHLINHSCAYNCDTYPYRGHILYVAIRRIFAGESITVNYGMGDADMDAEDVVCRRHACHCGSKVCTGTMHEEASRYKAWGDAWEKLLKKNFGIWYNKPPVNYDDILPPLPAYPSFIAAEDPKIYPGVFGSEIKPPLKLPNKTIPSLPVLRKTISKTGRQLSFPKLRITVYGVRNEFVLAERK